MKQQYCRQLLLLIVGIFLGAQSSFAMNFGKVDVVPMINVSAEHHSNIFYETENEQADVSMKVTPGVLIGYSGSKGNYLNAGYSVDLVYFSDYSDNNYQTHKPFVSLGLESPVGLYLKAEDKYIHTEDLYGTEEQYGLGERTTRWHNTADLAAGYTFADRYTLEAQYRNYLQRFDLISDEWQDRNDSRYGVSFAVKVAPKTEVFAQYRMTIADFDSQNDSVANDAFTSQTSMDYKLHDYLLGVRLTATAKINGEIKAGWGQKEYDNEYDPDGNAYEDDSTWIAETRLNYQMLQRTLLTLNVARAYKPSVDMGAPSSSYVDTIAGLALKQGLGNQILLNLGAQWRYKDYVNEAEGLPEKDFTIYDLNAGVELSVNSWLKAIAEYRYETKGAGDSQYDEYEYDASIFSVGLTAAY
ncbi:MAG: outer membrane beta-barrel protein [Lentisphaeria bacterium]|nr:outer membrane beta-barrel protein [Lentisphaeria bacterium]